MPPLRVNPNRMELMRLKRRHQVALRGHKLLKDKLDELLKEFLARIAECRRFRASVEAELAEVYGLFVVSRAEAGEAAMERALATGVPREFIGYAERNIMSVRVPVLTVAEDLTPCCYSHIATPAVLDAALDSLAATAPRLISLAEREKTIELLAAEIERTRRRVNALEHVLIPQIAETIRAIDMKLEEAERSSLTRLMKVKDLISG